MQEPELQELLGHGVEARVGQHVVVVVVADGAAAQVQREGPEAVDGHVLAQPQGRADQEQPRGEALGVDALALPEAADAPQEGGVGEQHRLPGAGVLQRVIDPQRRARARAHGERRHVDVAAVVHLHAVHKGLPGPQQVLEPAMAQGKSAGHAWLFPDVSQSAQGRLLIPIFTVPCTPFPSPEKVQTNCLTLPLF